MDRRLDGSRPSWTSVTRSLGIPGSPLPTPPWRRAKSGCTRDWAYSRPARRCRRRDRAVEKALALDPTLADAHRIRASIAMNHDWDRNGAERDLGRALELGPGSAAAHLSNAWRLVLLERQYDLAHSELEEAERLDPLDLQVQNADRLLSSLSVTTSAAPSSSSKGSWRSSRRSPSHTMRWATPAPRPTSTTGPSQRSRRRSNWAAGRSTTSAFSATRMAARETAIERRRCCRADHACFAGLCPGDVDRTGAPGPLGSRRPVHTGWTAPSRNGTVR